MGITTRRQFVQSATTLSLAGLPLSALAASSVKDAFLLIGTQTTGTSKGIYAYTFNTTSGQLKQTDLAAPSDMPSFLTVTPNKKIVVAVNELETYLGKKSGGVSSFKLDESAAKLNPINEVASGGGAPCHVAIDHTARCVFVANYSGGSAASYQLSAQGHLSEVVSFFQFTGSGPDKSRQEAPHAHRVTVSPDNRFVMVNDLGLDLIHIYHLDSTTAKLTPNEPAVWKATPGSGPRALQFHPNGKWAYCVTEMKSSVNVLHWNAAAGTLETVQELSLSPDGFSGETAGDDIVFDHEGKYAYIANRLKDFIATLSVSPVDGRLKLLERSSCNGKVPRHLALDPTGRWLLLANQVSDNIAVFARDSKTGLLSKDGKSFPLSRPQCIVFV